MGDLIDLGAFRRGRRRAGNTGRFRAEFDPPYVLLSVYADNGTVLQRWRVFSEYYLRCLMDEAMDVDE